VAASALFHADAHLLKGVNGLGAEEGEVWVRA